MVQTVSRPRCTIACWIDTASVDCRYDRPSCDRRVRSGVADHALSPDGTGLLANGEITVIKIAIEPVWYLPGIAPRLGIDESAESGDGFR